MFHTFLERELEFDSSLFHVNDCTNCAKKRTSQNNWTRGFTLNVHNSEINGNIIVIDNDKEHRRSSPKVSLRKNQQDEHQKNKDQKVSNQAYHTFFWA